METDPSEEITRVTAKNPKKVEAGRKGAAARKAKQEALKEELRKAKETLAEREEEEEEPVPSPPSQPPQTQVPWVVLPLLGAAAAIGIYLYNRKPTIPRPQPAQLNTSPDPFDL